MDDSSRKAAAERVELETKIGFLEHTVDALNDVILEQGRTLETLERRVANLEDRAAAGTEGVVEDRDPLSEQPPHY